MLSLQFPVLTAGTRAIFLKAPPQLSAATAAALQFPSLTDGRRVGRGAAVVNARGSGCLVYMIYGTKIASVRCNFTHQLRLRLNQNRGSEKHDEREQKSAFQCSNTKKQQQKNRWMKAQALQVQFQACACKHGVSSSVTQRLRASLHL